MNITKQKKDEIWNYVLQQKDKIPVDLNIENVKKIKDNIWLDNSFWMDIVNGHGLLERLPEELKNLEINIYNHFIEQFWIRVKRKLEK